MLCTTLLLLAGSVVFEAPDPDAAGPNLLSDPGFEIVAANHWAPYGGGGYRRAAGRTGQGIELRLEDPSGQAGAQASLRLDQAKPEPLLVSGWSAAEGVTGAPGSGYSLYVDCIYADGTPLWGVHGAFRTGTHGWERVSFVVLPEKPIRSLSLYCLFRGHAGTAWFDDVAIAPLAGRAGVFDGRAVIAKGELVEGLLLRDQAREGTFAAVEPGKGKGKGKGEGEVSIELEELRRDGARFFTATCAARAEEPRLLTLYWIMPLDATGGTFFRDILTSEPIRDGGTASDVVPVSAGATGTAARYPIICVSPANGNEVQALAVPMDQPVIARLAYHAAWKVLSVAFDFALDRRVKRFPTLRWVEYRVPAAWGFRAAYRRYQELHPASFVKRVRREGIWMPFYDIAKVAKAEDFHFGFKEGTNNVAYDQAHGVLTFRYVEPQSHWLPVPREIPRTSEGVLGVLAKRIDEGDRQALVTASSGIWDSEGKYCFLIHDAPWCDGAVFVLNPDPGLSALASKARLNYDPGASQKEYEAGVDGEYLDSLEGWCDYLNFRDEHIRESTVPLTFDRASAKPCLLTAFSVYAYTAFVAEHVHRQGLLLMANGVPYRFGLLCHFLDVAGTETDWKRGGRFEFDPPERMAYRRTMMGSKPYLFLQNTKWEAWTAEDSESFMKWCLFWGMYPGFFSPDASTRHYFESPERYERDRHLFKRYVPLIMRVSQAGWEPVTDARVQGGGDISVERWGDPLGGSFYLTLFNSGASERAVSLHLEGEAARSRRATELLSGRSVEVRRDRDSTIAVLALPPRDVAVLELSVHAP